MKRGLKIEIIDEVVEQFCNQIGKEAWRDLRCELVERQNNNNAQSVKCEVCEKQDAIVNVCFDCYKAR